MNLLGGTDPALPRTGWTAAADSQETVKENGAAANVLDGNTATIWHTAYGTPPAAPLPHQLTVDMKVLNLVFGLSYLPRQGSVRNGTIGQYRIETSTDGTTWGAAAATGAFSDIATACSAPRCGTRPRSSSVRWRRPRSRGRTTAWPC